MGLTYAHLNNTYTPGDWGARGKLDDAFDYLYNNNYMQPKNTICLDAPASLVSVSQQSWDNNAYLPRLSGKLCDEYEGSLGPFEVNKVFYTLPTCLYAYYTQPEYDPVNNQDLYHKLVIAVKINGRNYYYPFYLHHLQPNMTYRINTITLKGEPSEYPNVWPRGGVVSRSTSTSASKAAALRMTVWASAMIALASCSVKEDRTDCPCWLTVRASYPNEAVSAWYGTHMLFDGLMGQQVDRQVPRGEVAVLASCGSFTVHVGEQMDELFASIVRVNTQGETAEVTPKLNKQFARVHLEFKESDEGRVEHTLVVEGNVKGSDIRTLQPVTGPFRCTPTASSGRGYEVNIRRI